MQPLILDAYKHLETLHKSRAFPSYREKEAGMLLADMQKGTFADVRVINAALREGMITGELQGTLNFLILLAFSFASHAWLAQAPAEGFQRSKS